MLNILQPHAEYPLKGVYFKDIEEPITPAIMQNSGDFEVVNPYPYVVYLGHFDIVPYTKIIVLNTEIHNDDTIKSVKVSVNGKEYVRDNDEGIELTQTGELVIAYDIKYAVDGGLEENEQVTFKMQVRNYADFVEHTFDFKFLSPLSREYRQLTNNLVDMAHSDTVISTKRNLDWVVNGYCKFDGKLFKIDQIKTDYSTTGQALRFSNLNKIYTLRLIEVTNDWGQ